jgi:hypothetical protein
MPRSGERGNPGLGLRESHSTDRRINRCDPPISRFVHATRHPIRDLLECADQTKEAYPMDNHSSALVNRHAGLDARIADEIRRPSPDQMILASLKKQKLKIKEALTRI